MTPANILLIHSDQHRWDCLGHHHHPVLQTPHLNRLAEKGIDFTSAYCPIPLCTPARASLLTGTWPSRHRCITNSDTEAHRPLVAGLPIWSEILAGAGYRQGYVGKWHVDALRDPRTFGYDDYVSEGDYRQYRESAEI